MKYSEVKEIIELAENLGVDTRELVENIDFQETNFEIGNYRFLEESEAVSEVVNMFEGDTYLLGCFNSCFISDSTGIDFRVVEALQKSKNFPELGQLILDYTDDDLTEMIEEYIRVDGYGHALCSYDGEHEERTLNGVDYIYFRTN